MIDARSLQAIETSDTDELLRVINGHCRARAWQDLVELRRHCHGARARGKQLWGVEEHIRYRLVLEGPPELAGAVVSEGRAHFTLGPLPEVAATTKTWAELEPHLAPGPERDTFAAERVARGDRVTTGIPDIPNRLQAWEPTYPHVAYKPDRVESPAPRVPALTQVDLSEGVAVVEDIDSEAALADLVQPWIEESNGRYQTATVQGGCRAAIRALGPRAASVAELSPQLALSWMAWAAASGGAHGRRRGLAAGRYLSWWALCALGDLDWPPNPDAVAPLVARVRFYWFSDGSMDPGWVLRLAIEDPESRLAWAISANDMATGQ